MIKKKDNRLLLSLLKQNGATDGDRTHECLSHSQVR